jgi:hypothetical protein
MQPKVQVTWVDSRRDSGDWEYLDEFKPMIPAKVETVGFLLANTEEAVTLAFTIADNGQYCNLICIPQVSVYAIMALSILPYKPIPQ